MTAYSIQILEALRSNVESSDANDEWGCVYLDNARPVGMSGHAFAGHLSALERAELYRSDTGEFEGQFGYVRLEE
jgi:hypothetical protein